MVLNLATLVYIAPAVSSRPYAGWHEYAERSLRWEPDATHQVGETRVRPQRVPDRLHFKVGKRIGALVISFFEPQEGLLLLAQPQVNHSEGKCGHVLLLCRRSELVEHPKGLP